jgi:hypothetical protein
MIFIGVEVLASGGMAYSHLPRKQKHSSKLKDDDNTALTHTVGNIGFTGTSALNSNPNSTSVF